MTSCVTFYFVFSSDRLQLNVWWWRVALVAVIGRSIQRLIEHWLSEKGQLREIESTNNDGDQVKKNTNRIEGEGSYREWSQRTNEQRERKWKEGNRTREFVISSDPSAGRVTRAGGKLGRSSVVIHADDSRCRCGHWTDPWHLCSSTLDTLHWTLLEEQVSILQYEISKKRLQLQASSMSAA